MKHSRFEQIFRERMRMYTEADASVQQQDQQNQQNQQGQAQGQAQGQVQGQATGQATGQAQGQVGLINVQTGSTASASANNTAQGQSQGQTQGQSQQSAGGQQGQQAQQGQQGQQAQQGQQGQQSQNDQATASLVKTAQSNPAAMATIMKFGQDNGMVGKDVDTSKSDQNAYQTLVQSAKKEPQFMNVISAAIKQLQGGQAQQ